MRKPKWFSLLALLFVLSLVAAACDDGGDKPTVDPTDAGPVENICEDDAFGCVEVAEGDPITLGTLLVISGENESLGLDSQHGAELGLTNLETGEAEEVEGHTFTLENADDGCAPEQGTIGAQQLASNTDIAGVIGTSCSGAGEPASQILSEAGVVLISPSNTAPSLTAPDTHQPFYLRTAHNDKIQGAAMATFVTEELGLTTAATIHDGSPYAEQLQAVFAENFTALGGTITGQEAVTVGDTDMTPVLTSIAAGAPEFLYFPVFVAEGGLLASQGRETAGLEDTAFGGADGMLTPDWIAAAGKDAAEGTYLSGPDLNFAGDFYEATFLPAYNEAFGEPTSVFHAHAYDATKILIGAIREVAFVEDGTLFIPRTALKDAMFATSGFAGITGTLTCDEFGDCNPGATISVSVVENGDFSAIWP